MSRVRIPSLAPIFVTRKQGCSPDERSRIHRSRYTKESHRPIGGNQKTDRIVADTLREDGRVHHSVKSNRATLEKTSSWVSQHLFDCFNLCCRHVLEPRLDRAHAHILSVAHVEPVGDVRRWNLNPVA